MCKTGDVEGLQSLLSARLVSPFSLDGVGQSLLHVSFQLNPVDFQNNTLYIGVRHLQARILGFY